MSPYSQSARRLKVAWLTVLTLVLATISHRAGAMAAPTQFVWPDGGNKLRTGAVLSDWSSSLKTTTLRYWELRAQNGREQAYLAQTDRDTSNGGTTGRVFQQARPPLVQLKLGDWLWQNGEHQAAARAYRAALAGGIDSSVARLRIAQLDLSEERYEEARRGVDEVLSVEPNNTAALLTLALVEESLSDHEQAREHYLQVVRLEPENLVALNNLAYRLATDVQQFDEALRYAQRGKAVAPGNYYVDDTLGWIYYLKGFYDKALPYLEQAASGLPKVATVQFHLAMAYLRFKDLQRGQTILETALQLDPDLPEAQMARELLAEIQAASSK